MLIRVGLTMLGTGVVASSNLLGGISAIIDACIVAGICRVRGIAVTIAASVNMGVSISAIMGTKTIAGIDMDVGVDIDVGLGIGVAIVIRIDTVASDNIGSTIVNTDIAIVVVSVEGVSMVINIVVGIIIPLATYMLTVGMGV